MKQSRKLTLPVDRIINKMQLKCVKRPTTIDGMSEEEFIRNNADPIWLHQNEMWEYLDMDEENN